MAIAVGALLDGIPESVVLGVGLLTGGGVSFSVLAAVFISNVPEGLSSAAGMKRSGRPAGYVFGVWTTIAVVSGVAAGAILTLIADTMTPEAFQETRAWTGLITTGPAGRSGGTRPRRAGPPR